MIRELHAEKYGCLRAVTARLTPFHALIGPNDSGKSTILRAIRTLSQLVSTEHFRNVNGRWTPFDPGFPTSFPRTFSLRVETEVGSYEVSAEDHEIEGGYWQQNVMETFGDGAEETSTGRDLRSASFSFGPGAPAHVLAITHVLRGVAYFSLSETALRTPGGFSPQKTFLSAQGDGLPGVYFALRNDDDDAFKAIIDQTRVLFPTVKTVRVQPFSETELELEVELTNGTRVRAPGVSTGLLYYLAFAALPYVRPLTTVLIEEPENGLHPARVKEVMSVLRELSKRGTQVILTTHSPLVVNEMEPHEVTLVRRPSVDEGSILTPIMETPNFEKRSSVYSLGELWLSYADGKFEEPLFTPTVR